MTKMSILNTTVHSRSAEKRFLALYYASRNDRKGYAIPFFPNKEIRDFSNKKYFVLIYIRV